MVKEECMHTYCAVGMCFLRREVPGYLPSYLPLPDLPNLNALTVA